MTTHEILLGARAALPAINAADSETLDRALLLMADAIDKHRADILAANAEDMSAAEKEGRISAVMLDRLRLDDKRIDGMCAGIRDVAALPSPVGRVLSEVVRPNGLTIRKMSVGIGVIAIIYESRPNVTSDAAALTVKSGNVSVLRCGHEAARSAAAIVVALREGLTGAGLPAEAVSLVEDTTRAGARELMEAVGLVDLLIPRGGAGLIRACVENAKVPVIETGTGICHIYVDRAADLEMALSIIENAKTSRPSVCNAAEVVLVHRDIKDEFLPMLRRRLVRLRAERGEHTVEFRCDREAAMIMREVPADSSAFDTEFLDYILAVGVVGSVDEAIEHIGKHSTHHSDAIITEDKAAADRFIRMVDSAAVYVNASTRFTDGGEFGLGCEMGISTQKLPPRGPMGLAELTTYKYVITGNGQIRV